MFTCNTLFKLHWIWRLFICTYHFRMHMSEVTQRITTGVIPLEASVTPNRKGLPLVPFALKFQLCLATANF